MKLWYISAWSFSIVTQPVLKLTVAVLHSELGGEKVTARFVKASVTNYVAHFIIAVRL